MTDKCKKPHFTGNCTISFSLYNRNKISYDGQLSLPLAVHLLTTLCALTNAVCQQRDSLGPGARHPCNSRVPCLGAACPWFCLWWACAVSAARRCLVTAGNKCPPLSRGSLEFAQISFVLVPTPAWPGAGFQLEPRHRHGARAYTSNKHRRVESELIVNQLTSIPSPFPTPLSPLFPLTWFSAVLP